MEEVFEYNDTVYAKSPLPSVLRVTNVKASGEYALEIELSDGRRGTVDFAPFLEKEVYKPLRDKDVFVAVHINAEFGCLEWCDGNVDIDTAALVARLRS